MKTDKPETVEGVFEEIAEASLYGNLGLFVGSGFSKAVLPPPFEGFGNSPLSWIDLLKKACEMQRIEWNALDRESKSCPEIASEISKAISKNKNITIPNADEELKATVCRLTAWYPERKERDVIGPIMKTINPAWIITTNYDLVLEGLLPDCSSLGPNDSFVSPSGKTGIYHLHGVRTDPSSLILTNEDYVKLFRPNDYRLQKLPLLLHESTTVFLGYGAGDTNVLSALDWSQNVYETKPQGYPHDVFQFVFVNGRPPSPNTLLGPNGVTMIETDSLVDSLEKINKKIVCLQTAKEKAKTCMEQLKGELVNAGEKEIERFIDVQTWRIEILKKVDNVLDDIVEPFVNFLTRVYDVCWKNAEPSGAFEAYKDMMVIWFDCITTIRRDPLPAALFQALGAALLSFSYYLGYGSGQGHEAYAYWEKNKDRIPSGLEKNLEDYAEKTCCSSLLSLLKKA